MTALYLICFASLAACVASCIYHSGKVNRLEATLLGERSSVSLQIVDLQDRIAKLEVLEETHDLDMEERIADRIEKKWDDGLQSILNFDPFTGRYDE